MISQADLVFGLPARTIGGGTFYSLLLFKNQLLELKGEDIDVGEGVLLTPFYITDKCYELYIYEFSAKVVEKKQSYESFLLKYSNEERIEDVPKEVFDRMKKCYFELRVGESLKTKSIIDWVEYVLESKEIEAEVTHAFTRDSLGLLRPEFDGFEKGKLYFAMY